MIAVYSGFLAALVNQMLDFVFGRKEQFAAYRSTAGDDVGSWEHRYQMALEAIEELPGGLAQSHDSLEAAKNIAARALGNA